jgi:4-alpha-glucanotransferase
MSFPRSAGVLLHPTSLPSPYGVGDLGDGAYKFIDFLQRTKQSYWQTLPLGPTGYGNSPYLCYSALAGNPLLISPDKLVVEGWVKAADLEEFKDFPLYKVDFDRVIEAKIEILDTACRNFRSHGTAVQEQEFHAFIERESAWLPDYA